MTHVGMAIIFLATMFAQDNPSQKENLYSWQLQFQTYDQCVSFFDEYGDKLLNGLIIHAKQHYGKEMGIEYVSCANVKMDMTQSQPEVIGQRTVYKTE